jgi:hypothetical protein
MRLKATRNLINILIGAVAVLILAAGGIVWLQKGALAETEKVLAAREAELADGQKVARRQQMAEELLEQDRSQLRFLESGVSNAAYVPTLLKQLEDLARSTSNKVLGVRPIGVAKAPTRIQQRRDPDAQAAAGAEGDKKKVEKPEPYTRLAIEVSLIGTYQSSEQFVSRLMRFPKIVAVDEVSLQPHKATKADEPQDRLDVKLKLTAFVMKEEPVTSPSVKTASAAVGGIN